MHFAFLGTSGAVPSIERDSTSLVFDPDYHGEVDTMAAEARARFSGVVEISQEFVPYPL